MTPRPSTAFPKPHARLLLATLATLALLTACSSGPSGPVERYDLDGRYQLDVRVTASEDDRVPEGARGTTEFVVETTGDTAVLSIDGTSVSGWTRDGNTLRFVGRLDGCDARLDLRWTNPDRVRGSGRDVCDGLEVRYAYAGERTTTPFDASPTP
ncbi:MAG: hypothetical protein RI554_09665 [Trueperaceae bacterium]|nr:hypothetical protein [Trueperaceae bacterium]